MKRTPTTPDDGFAAVEISIVMTKGSKTAEESRKLDGHHVQDHRTIQIIDHEGKTYVALCVPGVTRKKALQFIADWNKAKGAKALVPVPDDGDDCPSDCDDGFGD